MVFGTPEYDELLVSITRKEMRHANYERACSISKEMSVHIFGDKPVHLLERSRPREDAEVKNYRLENYEPETKAAADKAIDIFSKMFNPSLYSITWDGKGPKSAELKEYVTEYYPAFNSVVSYNKEVILPKMFADPNGLIAVKPERFPEDDRVVIDPVVVTYGSENVWYEDIDHYLIFLSRYKEKEGGEVFTFEYFDAKFWRVFDVKTIKDEPEKIIIEILNELEHGFRDKKNRPEIPAWKLRGKPESTGDGSLIYKSFIQAASPHWNLAITHASDLLGAYINHIHPQRWALAEECNNVFRDEGASYPCSGGMIKTPKGSFACNKCGGTGKLVVTSPYETQMISAQKMGESDRVPFPPGGYYTVPVDATKMLEERVDKLLRRGLWAINMDVEDEVGENQSGIAKVIDRSAQYDSLFSVGSVMFDVHLNNEIYFINKWKFGILDSSAGRTVDDNLPSINKPTQFNIQSVSELTLSFDAGRKSGLDPNYLQTQQMEIVNKDLSTNPALKERTNLILALDPFPGRTPDEIDLIARYSRKTDAIIHFNISQFIDRALEEHENFKDMEVSEQRAILEGYASEIESQSQMGLVFSPE